MSEALDAALRLVRTQAALVRRTDARLSLGCTGVSLADFTACCCLAGAGARRPGLLRVDLATRWGLTFRGPRAGRGATWSGSDW
ncbi:hypothetical protein LT493_17865 [Streptomyces tricolor]|nr:hypothetical protein [Streptomyces tricolor]